MRLAVLVAAVLAAVPCAHAASIFFPEMPPTDRCETRDGRPGLCVSATARRCAAFPTLSSLLTLRPRVCRFDAIDPIVCCALSDRLFLLGSGEYQRELPVAEPPRGVVQVGTAPWTALVGLRTAEGPLAWLCGGALVSERVVLTAAHCAEAGSAHGSLAVRLGEHDLATDTDGATQEFAVQSVRIHPGFQQPAQRDDLALLLLDRPATVTRRVRPVCLPRQGEPLPADTLLVAAAFDLSGELGGAQPTATASGGRLTRHSASVAPLRVCSEQFEGLPHLGFIFPQGLMESSEVCVVRSEDAQCSHDSGGPLVTAGPGPSRLVGLRLLSGCQQQQPEVALRLDNYVDFIETTTAEMLEEAKQTSV
ncbi:Venom serine protease Bi-VSP [Amphibalanus amphitrite]|uniref:Venom serine protease Bi-VSP n=1 Tax=Amphibalanus amphitrite TaxID=1232801 RepID=A0A6A4VPU4_AMPAM|nr:Venom serine protease Bi-VSP [Amphibalanus amphitrite]